MTYWLPVHRDQLRPNARYRVWEAFTFTCAQNFSWWVRLANVLLAVQIWEVGLLLLMPRVNSAGTADIITCTTIDKLGCRELDATVHQWTERNDPRLHSWLRHRRTGRLQADSRLESPIPHDQRTRLDVVLFSLLQLQIDGTFMSTQKLIDTTLLLHPFNGLFFQDNLSKPAPER